MKKIIILSMLFAIIGLSNLVNSQNISTIAGTGGAGFSGDNGIATSAQLNKPMGVTVDGSGNIYIADYYNNRIRKIDYSNNVITTIAGNGTAGFSGDSGIATSAEINTPYSIAIDGSGNVYIADAGNNVIRKVDHSNGIISTFAGNTICGFSGDGVSATLSELSNPMCVAVDGSGNVFIADYGNNRIRKVDVSTGFISTVAGNGTGGFSGDNGAATSAMLNNPTGVAIDGSGNIYIADYNNHRIRKVDVLTNNISTFAGNGTGGFSGDNNYAISAQLNNPTTIAVDASGNLFISDEGNNRIRKVTTNGIIVTVVGDGAQGFDGDGVSLTLAELNNPSCVAIDNSGNIYIADFSNNRIRK